MVKKIETIKNNKQNRFFQYSLYSSTEAFNSFASSYMLLSITLHSFMLSTVESDTFMPSADAAAISSPVADKCYILSAIIDVDSSILLILCSAICMPDIRLSTVLPTSPNVFSVSSISSFFLADVS